MFWYLCTFEDTKNSGWCTQMMYSKDTIGVGGRTALWTAYTARNTCTAWKNYSALTAWVIRISKTKHIMGWALGAFWSLCYGWWGWDGTMQWIKPLELLRQRELLWWWKWHLKTDEVRWSCFITEQIKWYWNMRRWVECFPVACQQVFCYWSCTTRYICQATEKPIISSHFYRGRSPNFF